jgi:predicted ATPase/DNA-binding CsgD family transcriptional regulator
VERENGAVANIGPEAVSDREAEVLEALGDRLTNAQISQRLNISVRTVESHVSSLLRKLGATDRRDLAGYAGRPPSGVAGLPSPWTTFIGRTSELDELTEAVLTARLVTLLGPGGVGKTRLAVTVAQQVADKFPAGGAFVDLVPVGPDFLVQAVASAFGVVERAQEPLEHAVHDRLRAGRTLLVLDNCEHLIGAAARFTQAVLAACPDVVVLATSRERLGVAGERVIPLAPMGPDAELLFRDRAAATGEQDSAVIAEICRRLDGMPLAIELAAARSDSLGLDALLAGLDDNLRLLSRPGAGHDRHGSLRSVIDWSHRLLDEDERTAFRRLAVFAGAFDLRAATEVVGDGDPALTSDLIGRLADKSLLVHRRAEAGSRWRMLDTVHAYAREQLVASGEEADIRRRHLVWAASTAKRIEASLGAGEDWQAEFDAVADDLRAAIHATPPSGDEVGFALAMTLGHLSYARRFLVEARDHFAEALRRAPDETAAVTALRTAADAAFAEMRGELAFDLLQEAVRRATDAGDLKAAAIALAQASAIGGRCPALFVQPLNHAQLLELVERARAFFPVDDPEVATYLALAAAWDSAGGPTVPDPERARLALERARAYGDPVLLSSALDATSSAAAKAGRLKEASRLSTERLSLLDRLPRHDPRVGGEIADIFHMATEASLAAGELDRALTNARRSRLDALNQGLPHFAAAHLLIPLALKGSFDDALHQAAIMRDGWERAGRPASGWMAPAFFAAALVHGLRGADEEHARWQQLAGEVSTQTSSNAFILYSDPRYALHTGTLAEARLVAPDGSDGVGMYSAYYRAVAAEVAVAAGASDAASRLEEAGPVATENDFAAAQLLRAAGRFHHDARLIEQSLGRWEAIGARFERACTLLLLPDRAAEGEAELRALGCTIPASGPSVP